MTKYHRLTGFNNRKLFSHGSGGLKPQIKGPTSSVPGEGFLSGMETDTFLLHPLMVEGVCALVSLMTLIVWIRAPLL